MEPKANYTAVGAFVLCLFVGAVAFVLWIARSELGQEADIYSIYFKGSVSGLQTGAQVLYRGVPVGSVQSITIDPQHIESVHVLVGLKKGLPIRQDTIAQLEMVGVTGMALIQLSGGTQNSPPLGQPKGQRYPIIASAPSSFEKLFTAAPELLDRVNILLSPANQQHVHSILKNLDTITTAVAHKSGDMQALVDETRQLVKQFSKVLNVGQSTLEAFNNEGIAATRSFAKLTADLADLVQSNKPALDNFFNVGLFEFMRLITQMRSTFESINNLAAGVDRDPLTFFLGSANKEYSLNAPH